MKRREEKDTDEQSERSERRTRKGGIGEKERKRAPERARQTLTANRNAFSFCRMSVMAEMQVGATEPPDLVHTDRAAEPKSVKHTQTYSSHTHCWTE